MFLLLTLNMFRTFSTVSIVDFEQVNVSWESRDLIEGGASETFWKILVFRRSIPRFYCKSCINKFETKLTANYYIDLRSLENSLEIIF